MKRFLPFILISSVILQFFAPFAVDISKGKIQSNLTYAETTMKADVYNRYAVTDETVTLHTTVGSAENEALLHYFIGSSAGETIQVSATLYTKEKETIQNQQKNITKEDIGVTFTLLFDDKKIDPETEYTLEVVLRKATSVTIVYPMGSKTEMKYEILDSQEFTDVKTLTKGNTNPVFNDKTGNLTGQTKSFVGESNLPDCGFRNIGGCIARIFYYVLFVPTSFLFGLAGKVMDFTLMYSVSDSSYRTPFVSEGWKVIRDLCNMFFIFILLYIAITTILDLGGSKNKGTIVNVIIIGLFINFSLFATHLIIDASNIMARVFYNPKVLVIGEKDETSGEVKNERESETGTIQLSQAIVSKINPQRLLLAENQGVATNQATSITNNANITTNEDNNHGITAGTFILVTLMASIVNFIGMMTFLTISLSFIGRVVGLWVAMVLSPLAFLSYTVPETKNWDYVGWSSWWSETVKTAFMAPVFVFFMYIIVMFLESNMGLNLLTESSGLTDFNKILSIIVPFIVIIVLLKQAEKISTKLAGQVAGTFTKGVGAIGGVALGGAALGVGALGKNTIGRTMAKASRGETSTQKFEAAKNAAAGGDMSLMNSLTKWEKIKGRTGSYATGGFLTGGKKSLLGSAYGQVDISVDPTTGQRKMQVVDGKGIGGIVNKKQEKVDEINKARSKWDETKKDAGVEGLNDKNLSAPDIKKMKKKFKDKNKSEYENEARNGEIDLRDASGQQLIDATGSVIRGEKAYRAENEERIKNQYINDYNNRVATHNANPQNQNNQLAALPLNAQLKGPHKKKMEQMLNMEFNAILKTTVDHRSNEKFKETREKAKQNISMTDRGISGANKGSFNPANLVNLKSDKRDSFFSKVPKALIVAIATGVRLGLKTVSPSLKTKAESKPQTSAIKEMGEIISGAIKGLGDITSGKK